MSLSGDSCRASERLARQLLTHNGVSPSRIDAMLQGSLDHFVGGGEQCLSEPLRPSAFAVLRLMTKSNFVGCRTGRSEGFSPFRIRPV